MISVTEHERKCHDFDPTIFYENRSWNRRPDGIVIIKNHRAIYILDFKRHPGRNVFSGGKGKRLTVRNTSASSRCSKWLPWMDVVMMIAFITINSGLVPLIESPSHPYSPMLNETNGTCMSAYAHPVASVKQMCTLMFTASV